MSSRSVAVLSTRALPERTRGRGKGLALRAVAIVRREADAARLLLFAALVSVLQGRQPTLPEALAGEQANPLRTLQAKRSRRNQPPGGRIGRDVVA